MDSRADKGPDGRIVRASGPFPQLRPAFLFQTRAVSDARPFLVRQAGIPEDSQGAQRIIEHHLRA